MGDGSLPGRCCGKFRLLPTSEGPGEMDDDCTIEQQHNIVIKGSLDEKLPSYEVLNMLKE